MINFNRLMITSGIISIVSILGVSNKAMAQISTTTTTNDTATFNATATVAAVCQFNDGTFADITSLDVTDEDFGLLDTTGGNVSFSCNSAGAQIDADVTLSGTGHDDTVAVNGAPTTTFTLTPATAGTITGTGLNYTINSPVNDEQVNLALNIDYAAQLLAGNYTANIVLTITP